VFLVVKCRVMQKQKSLCGRNQFQFC
jgi:hypothetical protein